MLRSIRKKKRQFNKHINTKPHSKNMNVLFRYVWVVLSHTYWGQAPWIANRTSLWRYTQCLQTNNRFHHKEIKCPALTSLSQCWYQCQAITETSRLLRVDWLWVYHHRQPINRLNLQRKASSEPWVIPPPPPSLFFRKDGWYGNPQSVYREVLRLVRWR